jgi:hypothetical protein
MTTLNSLPDLLAYFKPSAHYEISKQLTTATGLLKARMKEQGLTSIRDAIDAGDLNSVDGKAYRIRIFVEEGKEVSFGLSEIVMV